MIHPHTSKFFSACLVIASLVWTACGLAQAAEALPKAVRIAAVANVDAGKVSYSGTPALVDKEGWLAAELAKLGVKLEWVPVTTNSVAAQVNEAFAQSSIDFAAYGDLPSLIANAAGIRTRLIVPGSSLSYTYLVVPADSSAKSLLDLKGKRIALHRGRPWEYPFSRLVALNNLNAADFKILNLNPQAGAAAVTTGSADAFFTLSDAYILEDKKVGKIIWSSKSAPPDWQMRAELWGEGGFVDRYPQLTQLVTTAFVKAHFWASQKQNFEAYLQIARRSGQGESVIRRELDNANIEWKDRWSPLFDDSLRLHYVAENRYAKEAKLTSKEVDVNALFAPQFVDKALVDLKLQKYWTPKLVDKGQ